MRLMTLPNNAIQGKIDALEDPSYVVYERGIVSVDWNNWPQVEYRAAAIYFKVVGL